MQNLQEINTYSALLNGYGPVLNYYDLSKIFKRHTKTIQNLIKSGEFPFQKIGKSQKSLFRTAEVAKFIDCYAPKKGRPIGSKNKLK